MAFFPSLAMSSSGMKKFIKVSGEIDLYSHSCIKVRMKKEVGVPSAYGTGEISLKKLIWYNVVFFVPLVALYFVARLFGDLLFQQLETTPAMAANFSMFVLTFIYFFFIIPYIRRRENVRGVRYALYGFLIVAVGVSIPAMFIGNFHLFLLQLPHIASYVLLSFIYTPEVLGMDIDISKWFKHNRQLMIILIYSIIVLGYVFGLGYQFYLISLSDGGAFMHQVDKPTSYATYVYYSIITFATIGYGDITPVTTMPRLLVGVEAVLGAIVNVIFIAILFVYISNFQAFIRGIKQEEKQLATEERKIEKEEKKIEKLEEKLVKKRKKK